MAGTGFDDGFAVVVDVVDSDDNVGSVGCVGGDDVADGAVGRRWVLRWGKRLHCGSILDHFRLRRNYCCSSIVQAKTVEVERNIFGTEHGVDVDAIAGGDDGQIGVAGNRTWVVVQIGSTVPELVRQCSLIQLQRRFPL